MVKREYLPKPDTAAPLRRVEYEEIDIEDIVVDDDRLHFGPDDISELAKSIEASSLIEPIVLRRRGETFHLVAGYRRLKACESLGRLTIGAVIHGEDAPERWHELAEIDENLIRRELSPAARALLTERRKAIYEDMYPETKHGKGKGHKLRSFADDTASSTGRSRGDIQRDATRAKQLGETDLKRLIGTTLDSGAELDALRRLPPDVRDRLIQRAVAGERVTARTKPEPGELTEIATRFALLFQHADEDERIAFTDAPIAAEIKRLLTEEWAEQRVEYDRSKVH
jgi:ParB-like chromosome segregation protein Spo0J